MSDRKSDIQLIIRLLSSEKALVLYYEYLINPCPLGSIFISFVGRTRTRTTATAAYPDNERVVSAAAAVITFLYSGLFSTTFTFATLTLLYRQ